ncbi:sodium:solute symporter family transporter [Streptomyces viridochromogenes]|uniref:sodium:solute symporter family transporter n=1 Tax=Streptomyces viridochromogenes TaxID=1938 RepID=UPI00069F397B|nr:hypothetical protein [Streptomyces viridochromogenes]KOG16610.1 hypothetical protein ADK36_26710 [Streptomyces viridochromogenes]KOG17316.1 hypothetical protein ADK35_24190 [Streptomyces viridochromogenes]
MRPDVLLTVSPTNSDTRGFVLVVFLGFIVAILFMGVFIGPEDNDVDGFYTAGRRGGALGGALAIAGALVSADMVVAVGGFVAFSGYDGLFVALCSVMSLLVLLLLTARLRGRLRYTLGDLLVERAPGPAVRLAGAVVTLCAVLPLLILTLVGGGVSIARFLGLSGTGAEQTVIVLFGSLIVLATIFGGMRGTRILQIVKTVVLFMGLGTLVFLVFWRLDGDVGTLFGSAAVSNGQPGAIFRTGLGLSNSDGSLSRLDFAGLVLTTVLGAAFMPHVTMHLKTVSDGGRAQSMVRRSIFVVAVFAVFVGVLGLGASALVGNETIIATDPSGNATVDLLIVELVRGLSSSTGGALLIVLVACGTFVTTLAVVAGITLAAATTISHDLYAKLLGGGRVNQAHEVSATRWASAGVGALGIMLAVAAVEVNLRWLANIAFSIAASCILPAVLHVLYWRRCTRAGLLSMLYGGLFCTLVLQFFSPVFSGERAALFPHQDFSWFPLHTASLISVPIAFLLGSIGNAVGTRRRTTADHGLRPRAHHGT